MSDDHSAELSWLQGWYQEQCDGDWEHQHGIKIETIDNPGWEFHVSLTGTALQTALPWEEEDDRGERDWIVATVKDGEFHAFGDPTKLARIIQRFRQFVQAESPPPAS